MQSTRGVWLGLVLAAAPAAGVRADGHVITDLDPTKVYDVVVEGTTQLSGRQPDPFGLLAFDLPLTGGIQIVEAGSGDVTPPSAIANLTSAQTSSSAHILWTAPGDDGQIGTAAGYEITWASSPDALGSGATHVPTPPAPGSAGTLETFRLTRLPADATVYVAVRARDDAGRWSPLSNVVSIDTAQPPEPPPDGPSPDTAPGDPGDVTAPATVVSLRAIEPGLGWVLLAWTAPGDDGTTGTSYAYELRHATSTIDAASFPSATIAAHVPAPAAPGQVEAVLLPGLTPETTHHFALVTVDDAGNRSAISNVVSATTAPGDEAPIPPPPPQVASLAIERVYPNPIRGEAVFRFVVPELAAAAGGEVRVTLDLFDVAGRRVGRVVDEHFPAGVQEVTWSPQRAGRAFAPGFYVGVLRAGGRSARTSIAVAR